MAVIVKIGYADYLVRNETAALSIIKAMVGAVRLESKYFTGGKEVFWPSDRQESVSVQTVMPENLWRQKPAETAPGPKQIGNGGAK